MHTHTDIYTARCPNILACIYICVFMDLYVHDAYTASPWWLCCHVVLSDSTEYRYIWKQNTSGSPQKRSSRHGHA